MCKGVNFRVSACVRLSVYTVSFTGMCVHTGSFTRMCGGRISGVYHCARCMRTLQALSSCFTSPSDFPLSPSKRTLGERAGSKMPTALTTQVFLATRLSVSPPLVLSTDLFDWGFEARVKSTTSGSHVNYGS